MRGCEFLERIRLVDRQNGAERTCTITVAGDALTARREQMQRQVRSQ
jgi:hypothetical protein